MASPTPKQIKDELIAQRVECWRAKQRKVDRRDLAIELSAMGTHPWCSVAREPGCLLSDGRGGYVYVPYDDSTAGLAPELLGRIRTLDSWMRNPRSEPMLAEVDRLLEGEVKDKCFFEFQDDGDASQLDTWSKVKMLAKYRLMKEGVVGAASDGSTRPQFEFVVTNITEFGDVQMERNYLDWTCTFQDVLERMEASSRPGYGPQDAIPRQLRQLERIELPEDAAQEAQAMMAELKSPPPAGEDQAGWVYFLCDGSGKDARRMEDRTWVRIRDPYDFMSMKRSSRRQGLWPVTVRQWQLRHYNICRRIVRLQQRQLLHCEALSRKNEAACAASGDGEEDFDCGSPVSTLDYVLTLRRAEPEDAHVAD